MDLREKKRGRIMLVRHNYYHITSMLRQPQEEEELQKGE